MRFVVSYSATLILTWEKQASPSPLVPTQPYKAVGIFALHCRYDSR